MLSVTRPVHISRRIKLVTPAAEEPVTLAEAKAHLRITNTASDALITALIIVSRQALEKRLGMVFVSSTYKQTMDSVPGAMPYRDYRCIESGQKASILYPPQFDLMLRPAVSVTSITTYDEEDAATVVDAATYRVDTSDPMWQSRVSLKHGAQWPTALRLTNAFEVLFVVGYANAAAVPGDIKQAIMQLVAWLYDHRGSCDCSASSAEACMIPCGASLLVSNYIFYELL